MTSSLLREQDALAVRLGPVCRFLHYRCAAIRLQQQRHESFVNAPPEAASGNGAGYRASSVTSGSTSGSAARSYSLDDVPIRPPPQTGTAQVTATRNLSAPQTKPRTSPPPSSVDPSTSAIAPSATHSQRHNDATGTPTATDSLSSRHHEVAAVDVDAVPLKPPGHAEPNFERATADGDIPAINKQQVARDECSICGRLFAADRLAAHTKVCAKSEASQKRRKVFDVRQRRVEYLVAANQADPSEVAKVLEGGNDSETERKLEQMKNRRPSWRQQRAQLRQSLGTNGNGAVAAENADTRVLCSGCGRKFAPDAAERHIPRCVEKSRGR